MCSNVRVLYCILYSIDRFDDESEEGHCRATLFCLLRLRHMTSVYANLFTLLTDLPKCVCVYVCVNMCVLVCLWLLRVGK